MSARTATEIRGVHRFTETVNASKFLICRVSGRRTGFRFAWKRSRAAVTLARGVARWALGGAFAAGLVMIVIVIITSASVLAVAQESTTTNAAARPAAKPAAEQGLLGSIGDWFVEQADKVGSSFKNAGKNVQSFSHEAGIAARTTVEGAKDAAGAFARIPNVRVVDGHEKCNTAPNGAPDCWSAAAAMCKAKGFETGKSADMTTAEVCPGSVYLAGRSSGPGCKTETFVSRALCQ
jgi:hypothetical protein